MNILAIGKALLQRRNIGRMRQHAQFDLRIIGADQHIARLGDEGAADAAAFLGADRDVLQIRVGGR